MPRATSRRGTAEQWREESQRGRSARVRTGRPDRGTSWAAGQLARGGCRGARRASGVYGTSHVERPPAIGTRLRHGPNQMWRVPQRAWWCAIQPRLRARKDLTTSSLGKRANHSEAAAIPTHRSYSVPAHRRKLGERGVAVAALAPVGLSGWPQRPHTEPACALGPEPSSGLRRFTNQPIPRNNAPSPQTKNTKATSSCPRLPTSSQPEPGSAQSSTVATVGLPRRQSMMESTLPSTDPSTKSIMT